MLVAGLRRQMNANDGPFWTKHRCHALTLPTIFTLDGQFHLISTGWSCIRNSMFKRVTMGTGMGIAGNGFDLRKVYNAEPNTYALS